MTDRSTSNRTEGARRMTRNAILLVATALVLWWATVFVRAKEVDSVKEVTKARRIPEIQRVLGEARVMQEFWYQQHGTLAANPFDPSRAPTGFGAHVPVYGVVLASDTLNRMYFSVLATEDTAAACSQWYAPPSVH